MFDKDFEKEITDALLTYDAEDIRIHPVGDKLRVTFKINDKEKSMKCFGEFTTYPYLHPGQDSLKIYLTKPEEVFEKYGDEEAELYYKS